MSTQRRIGFETTLAGRGYISLLRRLKDAGYRIHLFFLWLPSPEMAVERVRDRVLAGGHSVPEEVVRRRFSRGLVNLYQLYAPLLDSWLIFDNAEEKPRVVALCLDSGLFVLDRKIFDRIKEATLR